MAPPFNMVIRATGEYSQPRWLSGIKRSRVHSLWLLVDHCVLRNWDRILVRAVKGLISRAGMVSICPLLWQRDVKLQQTNKQTQENTLPCVWWGNPLTPYKHCHTGSSHPGRTEVIDLLSSTRQQAQAVTHPSTKRDQYCLPSWVIIYYMWHTIDKWNLYWSYTIKCIFAGIKISRFDPH